MPASTYPIMVGDPILRTCRRCRSRVAVPSMCEDHPRTCLTCCISVLKRRCGIERRMDEDAVAILGSMTNKPYFPDMATMLAESDKLKAELESRS